MAKGALKTFFRQDAGYPEEEPDLTDFLLDSMIQNGPRVGGVPVSTAAGRVTGMRGYHGQQGAPGPAGMAVPGGGMRRGPWGVPLPAAGAIPQPDVTVPGRSYPAMPGPMAEPRPMPQMAKPTWIDYLSQAGGAIADGMNARSGIRSNFFGQIGAQQQGLRDREFQHAMAERGALENAARLAHEYEWRKYGAGQSEAREDRLRGQQDADIKFRDQLLAQQKAQAEWPGKLMAEILPLRFDAAETDDEVNALEEKSLLETQGNPELMKKVREAASVQRTALQWKRLGQPTFDWMWGSKGSGAPAPYTHPTPPSTSPYGDRLPYGPWVPFQK